MEMLDPKDLKVPMLNVHHIIDVTPAPKLQPNLEALKAMKRGRRSLTGTRQSEHSKRRQNFITGLNPNGMRLTRVEIIARQQYIEEWNERFREYL